MNLYAFSRFMADPDLSVDAVLEDWAAQRYPAPAVPHIVSALKRSEMINHHGRWHLEYWFTKAHRRRSGRITPTITAGCWCARGTNGRRRQPTRRLKRSSTIPMRRLSRAGRGEGRGGGAGAGGAGGS